jgi:hypothetical protein
MFGGAHTRAVRELHHGAEEPDFVKVDQSDFNGPRLSLGGTPWYFCGANCYYLMVR